MSANYDLRTCLGCKRDYPASRRDGLCESCRAAEIAKDMARTTCPRCKQPMEPAPYRLICGDCSTADLLESVAKWGSG